MPTLSQEHEPVHRTNSAYWNNRLQYSYGTRDNLHVTATMVDTAYCTVGGHWRGTIGRNGLPDMLVNGRML